MQPRVLQSVDAFVKESTESGRVKSMYRKIFVLADKVQELEYDLDAELQAFMV